ncbi:bifunctional diguanylate cyclase/phosphodiesterase [Acetobacterium bakii]|uniref:bifunctional diguanylate cyclase/phosphodiesterase n=1 Tax=Acetobacterium bakii TaxID=52689 RepID=UPI001364CA80|nr:EAL domain-containing protein [Acetobacterium bakii]
MSYQYITMINHELKTATLLYLSEVSEQGAKLVETKVGNKLESLEAVAKLIEIHGNFDQKEMLAFIQNRVESDDDIHMGIAMLNGNLLTSDGSILDIRERSYFKEALTGKSVVSDTIDDYAGLTINIYATPIYNGNELTAVLLASVETESLKEYLEVNTFDDQGYSYIVKANGDAVIASLHSNSVGAFDNMFDVLKDATFFQGDDLETIAHKMNLGESGSFASFYNNLDRYTIYRPLGINDWYMMTVVPSGVISDQATKISRYSLLLIAIALTVISLLFLSIFFFLNRSKRELEKIAYTDEVTGGNNWRKFTMDTHKILNAAPEKDYAIILLDIASFRFINEDYGHEVGDTVLRHIMKILKTNMGKDETCGRVSGDNFVILTKTTGDQGIIKRIRGFNRILDVDKSELGIKVKLKCCFGIYKIKDKSEKLEKMREKANLARIAAKNEEGMSWFIYSEEFRKTIFQEKEIVNRMEYALVKNEFEMYLQPKYNLHLNQYCGAEALVRWNDPQKGLIKPDDFIPIFEQSGFIKKLDMFMIEEVCKVLKRWEEKDFPERVISVNISRKNLKQASFIPDVLKITDRYQINRKNLEFELTESSIFEDIERIIEVGKAFRDYGFKMSMDDFGSGYSSINLLGTLPLDTIKMDKGFFRDSLENKRDYVVVKAIIDLIKKLGMTVVAEGIEKKEEVDILRALNCDVIQGYYFGKPVPLDEFEKKF